MIRNVIYLVNVQILMFITDDDILDQGGKLKSKLLLKLKKYEKMDTKEIKKLNSDTKEI